MVKNIRAWTMFSSQYQKEYSYEIHFSIDTQTGKVTFQGQKSKLRVRLYMLLDLLEDVYEAIMPKCIERESGKLATFYNEYPDINFSPTLIVSERKIYWLNSFVDGKTIYNPDCLVMTRWIHNIPEDTADKLAAIFARKNRRKFFNGWKWRET